MRNLKLQFADELKCLEDDIWKIAELTGHQKSDDNFRLLVGVFTAKFIEEHDADSDEDKKWVEMISKHFPPVKGSRLDASLGKCLFAFAVASRDTDCNIRFLSIARESLGEAMILVEFERNMANATSVIRAAREVRDTFTAKVLSDLGKKGAAAAHVETNNLRNEVVAYWSSSIDKSLSNEKAATELSKQFPLSHRTLRDYVAEAKKNLRSAGRV